MNPGNFKYIYGPVPSRRLGRSLGIDLVPFKTCSFDCVYCQLGRTENKTCKRMEYVSADEIIAELERKLAEEDRPDYISLAGSGEPTLNSGIGRLIEAVKRMTDIPVAVLTNSSLLWMGEVQDELMDADLLLPSLDAGDEQIFKYVNRPHEDLSFTGIVDGLASFSVKFPGEIWLEVLLLEGVTGIASEAEKIAVHAKRIAPSRIQLNTAYRPPAEEFACPVSAERILELKSVFPAPVDIISSYNIRNKSVSVFAHVKETEIIALLGRRPCTAGDVGASFGVNVTEALKCLDVLSKNGKVKTIITDGRLYYSLATSGETGGAV